MEYLRWVIHGDLKEAEEAQKILDVRGIKYRTEYNFEKDAPQIIVNSCFGRIRGLNNLRALLFLDREGKPVAA